MFGYQLFWGFGVLGVRFSKAFRNFEKEVEFIETYSNPKGITAALVAQKVFSWSDRFLRTDHDDISKMDIARMNNSVFA